MKIVITKNVLSFFESNGSFQFQRISAEVFVNDIPHSSSGVFYISGTKFEWKKGLNIIYIDTP